MIRAENLSAPYQVRFGNGTLTSVADAGADKGGADSAFRPHELLEAALASCMLMTLRMYAERHELTHEGMGVTVSLDRRDAERSAFECVVDFPASIPMEKRARMLKVVESCPVHRTLAASIEFRIESKE